MNTAKTTYDTESSLNPCDAPAAPRSSAVAAVVVAALGYFVDIFDLQLFSVLRTASLKDLGYEGEALLAHGVTLLNFQMVGMLLGGILWGVWGDKRGRVSVLFGSICLYSLANCLNGLVTTIDQYAVCRFLAGLGLAGELGAGLTLVCELFDRVRRGYAATLVATIGLCGAIAAAAVSELCSWRIAYGVGGVLGLLLLFLRISVIESGMFSRTCQQVGIRRGDLRLLLGSRARLLRVVGIILVGVPIWCAVGILMVFSPELGAMQGLLPAPVVASTVSYMFIGMASGDLASGLLSQLLRSRKQAMAIFLVIVSVMTWVILKHPTDSLSTFYYRFLLLGFGTGYWVLFVTVAAEQFGTNLRATVTTAVPNFVRGAVVPLTLIFQLLREQIGLTQGMWMTSLGCLAVASVSLLFLKETFGNELDFSEV